jgi:D-aminopeptidase
MRRIVPIILAALVAGASTAMAQTPSKSPAVSKSAMTESRDSVSLADVQRAADELARTVQAAVKKIKEDPELKVAALRLAKESVNATQVIVATQAETLQSLLDSLSKEIANATITIQQSKPKTH